MMFHLFLSSDDIKAGLPYLICLSKVAKLLMYKAAVLLQYLSKVAKLLIYTAAVLLQLVQPDNNDRPRSCQLFLKHLQN